MSEQVFAGLSFLYGLGVQARLRAYRLNLIKERRLSGIVVSIGNMTVGGTGKTPMTMFLAQRLLDRGYKPAILSRGYKGQLPRQPVAVNTSFWGDWKKYGDEPFLMAARLSDIPVIVAKNRYLAGLYAMERFDRRVFLLDDGYQHIHLYRNINILLINARNPFGSGFLLPRGPLREPLDQIKRANLVIITKVNQVNPEGLREAREIISKFNPLTPVFHSRFLAHNLISVSNPSGFPLDLLKEKRILAFSGIADPHSFKQLLEETGSEITDHLIFPDHYQYNKRDLEKIRQKAVIMGAKIIITTEKDFVKLKGSDHGRLLTEFPVWALCLGVEILDYQDGWEEFWSAYFP